jgi:hypothetical protein
MPELRQARPPATIRPAPARPFKPYVYRGDEPEPDAVAAACRRHRRVTAAIRRRLDALEAQAAAREDPASTT